MITHAPPPGPNRRTPWGDFFEITKGPPEFWKRLARDYGDVSVFRVWRRRVYLLNNPDYIKDLLVSHHRKYTRGRGGLARYFFGSGLFFAWNAESHRARRRMMQPAFQAQRISQFTGLVARRTAEMARQWVGPQHATRPIDVSREFALLMLGLSAKMLFDEDIEKDPGGLAKTIIDFHFRLKAITRPLSILFWFAPTPAKISFVLTLRRLHRQIDESIRNHRLSGGDYDDILSSLIGARDETGAGMSDRDLHDEMLGLLVAGQDPTTNALTWTMFLLARHPEIEERLIDEVDRVLGGREVTPEDVPKLEYARCIFAESMRLFPPVHLVSREALEAHTYGGVSAPAGAVVMASTYVTHRDGRYFPDPERFDPDRWAVEGEGQCPRYAYYPFGGGPRVCIGEPAAWMIGVTVIATIAQFCRLRLVRDQDVQFAPMSSGPKGGMPMRVEKRHPAKTVLTAS